MTTMTHAPSLNFATAKISTTLNERNAENPLMATLRRQCSSRAVEVVLHHARARPW